MPARGKKHVDAAKRFDREQLHTPVEAMKLVKAMAMASFDETVELAIRLGIDPRKADQVLRGTVSLPSGTGKTVRVAVFAAGEHAQAARDAGAEHVGADDLVEKVSGGFFEFDVVIAHPELMGKVGRLGKDLGTRKLMPNPKTGTVTTDVAKAVKEFKGGRVEYQANTRSRGIVQVPIGRVSFTEAALLKNFLAVVDEVQRAKPAAAKGRYIRSIAVSSTMGPGVRIDPTRLKPTDEELTAAGIALSAA